MTMRVDLGPEIDAMVRQKVAAGLYASASEVVREALRLMESQDLPVAAKLEQLQQDIRVGLESGEQTPWDAEAIKREGRQTAKRPRQWPPSGLNAGRHPTPPRPR